MGRQLRVLEQRTGAGPDHASYGPQGICFWSSPRRMDTRGMKTCGLPSGLVAGSLLPELQILLLVPLTGL